MSKKYNIGDKVMVKIDNSILNPNKIQIVEGEVINTNFLGLGYYLINYKDNEYPAMSSVVCSDDKIYYQ